MDVQEGQGCFYACFMILMFLVGLVTFPAGIAVWILLILVFKRTRRA